MRYIKLFELFNTGKNYYEFKLTEDKTRMDHPIMYNYTYEFKTKHDINYKVYLFILNNVGEIDFETISDKKKFTSKTAKIKNYDSIKVFNTIKEIIEINKTKMNKLIIRAVRNERLEFYIRMIEHMGYEWMRSSIKKNTIIVKLKSGL